MRPALGYQTARHEIRTVLCCPMGIFKYRKFKHVHSTRVH